MTTAESITSPPAKRVKTSEETTNMSPSAEPSLQVKKLSETARLPTRGSDFAAGYDMYASKATTVPARGKVLVSTDISIATPPGTCKSFFPNSPASLRCAVTDTERIIDGRIAPRSGLAAKHFIDTGAGVIDEDYRGEVKVLLFNHADADFAIAEGDRIAQLVLERIATPAVVEVKELAESTRGGGGFGSTGTN